MPRPGRTSLLAVAGLVGALIGVTPAQAVPVGAEPLFEPSLTEAPQYLYPLGRTANGMAWTEGYAMGIWVQPTGGEAALDEAFLFPEMVGDLITEVSDDETTITWRTVADPAVHEYQIPAGIEYGSRTTTGFVGVQGTGPYKVVRVNLVDGGAQTVIGTSKTEIGFPVASPAGVAVMTYTGDYRYFAYASASSTYTGKLVATPATADECPWMSRAHLFCATDTGISRISLSTGAVNSAKVMPASMVETSGGVTFVDAALSSMDSPVFTLKTWASTATAPTTRIDKAWGLTGGLANAGSSTSVLVSRSGALGTAGLWSIPLPSGTPTTAFVAPAQPRQAGWNIAVAPGSVAWTDNSDRSGNLYTQDLAADGTLIGDSVLRTDHADPSALSASAGRFTYTANTAQGSDFYPGGTRLIDGETITTVDENGWSATLSGDRLLTEEMSYFGGNQIWRLRDLRTGETTSLDAAMDYDLWGERLVRLEENGRVTLEDLRTDAAPVELRPASSGSAYLYGTVHVAGDVVAWDVLDATDWTGLTGEQATRNVVTLAAATPLPEDVVGVPDISTGYVMGVTCDDLYRCVSKAIPLHGGDVIDLGVDTAAVDGAVVAGIDRAGRPWVQTLPAYTDAPRLLAHPEPSTLVGPGRTWTARVVASRILSECAVEIRDAESAVVRALDCVDPHAATTVEWDGTDELGEPLAAGAYTWHLVGATGDEALVDYDLSTSALTGPLTVTDDPAPTVTETTPADAALRVGQTANVTATFSESVTGVDDTSFVLTTPDGTEVPAAVTYDETTHTATLNPTASLPADTAYTATLTGGETGIRDAGGPLATTSWTFTTGPAPVLTKLTPAHNGLSATVSGNLSAVFNEPVRGVNASTFTLTKAGGTSVTGAVSYSSTTRTATFNPSAYLAPDTQYTATLTGGAESIRDVAGNPLTTRSWSFTTGPAPTVTGKSPAADATKVARTANVVAAFSESVTGVSGTTVKLKTASGATVSAAIAYSTVARKVTLNPAATLAANTKYTVTLTGGATAIRDTAGNPLATTSWSFTTGS